MAFSGDAQIALANERKERAARRKQAKEEGLFETLEGIEEYYLEIEGYTREEAEEFIIRECKRNKIELDHKTWIAKRADDVKVVINLVKENPEEVKLLLPILTTAFTSLASFALGAFAAKDSKPELPHETEKPREPIDRTNIERL